MDDCVGFLVGAYGAGPLLGDTARFHARSDSGYSASVGWTITGSAAIVPGSELPIEQRPGSSRGWTVLVRGLTLGDATITATDAASGRTASMMISVVDSSVISHITLESHALHQSGHLFTRNGMRVGDSLWIRPTFRDETGRRYQVRATQWSTSDSTVGRLRFPAIMPQSDENVRLEGAWVIARAAGPVDITAAFRSVIVSLRITVTP